MVCVLQSAAWQNSKEVVPTTFTTACINWVSKHVRSSTNHVMLQINQRFLLNITLIILYAIITTIIHVHVLLTST